MTYSKIFRSLILIIIIVLQCTSSSLAQNLKTMMGKLESKDFEYIEKTLTKYKNKSPIKASTYFVASKLFCDQQYHNYSIDSSYLYTLLTTQTYSHSSDKDLEHFNKYGINDSILNIQTQALEIAAFQIAISTNTEKSLNHFIKDFKPNIYTQQAIIIRNKLAFKKADSIDTFTSYKLFLDQYPAARQVVIAKKRYDKLLYLNFSTQNTESALASFIHLHPENPYIPNAEWQLYKMFNLQNTITEHLNFITKYPATSISKVSWSWLFELTTDKTNFLNQHPANPLWVNHSQQLKNSKTSLIPFVEEKKIGFYNTVGETIIPNNYQLAESIDKISSNAPFIAIKNQSGMIAYLDRNGTQITDYIYTETGTFHQGYIISTRNNHQCVIQATGFEIIAPKYTKITPFTSQVLKIQKGGKLGLISFTDSVLQPCIFDKITTIANNIIVFEKI